MLTRLQVMEQIDAGNPEFTVQCVACEHTIPSLVCEASCCPLLRKLQRKTIGKLTLPAIEYFVRQGYSLELMLKKYGYIQ